MDFGLKMCLTKKFFLVTNIFSSKMFLVENVLVENRFGRKCFWSKIIFHCSKSRKNTNFVPFITCDLILIILKVVSFCVSYLRRSGDELTHICQNRNRDSFVLVSNLGIYATIWSLLSEFCVIK